MAAGRKYILATLAILAIGAIMTILATMPIMATLAILAILAKITISTSNTQLADDNLDEKRTPSLSPKLKTTLIGWI